MHWYELSANGFSFHATPLDLSQPLRDLRAQSHAAWIFTSATLSVAGRFEHFARQLGLDEPVTLSLESPFDYARQALAYLPQGLPDPAAPDYVERVLDAVLPVLEASRGRAFLLFTSHRALRRAAEILGATIEWVELDGDGKLDVRAEHAVRLAAVIRRVRPGVVLAPTPGENQHPDHAKLSNLVRDAARLARYGGLAELREQEPHVIDHLLYYAVAFEDEAGGALPVLVDVSEPEVLSKWTAAMEAHASQAATRNYVEMQLTRARLLGMRAGVSHAIALYPNDPIVVQSLGQLGRGARRF